VNDQRSATLSDKLNALKRRGSQPRICAETSCNRILARFLLVTSPTKGLNVLKIPFRAVTPGWRSKVHSVPSVRSRWAIILRICHLPLEGLSHHLFTFLPERRGCGGIERISTNAFADSADDHVVRYDVTDVAVLAVLAAHLVSGRDDAGPHTEVAAPCGIVFH
jgi:hypothetical protein